MLAPLTLSGGRKSVGWNRSHLPVLMSTRKMCCLPTVLVHTLPWTAWRSPVKWIGPVQSFHSFAPGKSAILPVLGSSRPSEPWYMVSTQIWPFLSNSIESRPSGAFSLNFLIGYSTTLSVFGSNLPMNISPKSEYQTLPSLSTSTSCGSVVGRTMSYWVTTARVSRPLGRGSVFNSYAQGSLGPRLLVARYSANLRNSSGLPARFRKFAEYLATIN